MSQVGDQAGDDTAVLDFLGPGAPARKPLAPLNTDRALAILAALDTQGPMTADEFITHRGAYVNSWAPTFSGLRAHGLVARTGAKRTTSHGSSAFVVEITEAGRGYLEAAERVA